MPVRLRVPTRREIALLLLAAVLGVAAFVLRPWASPSRPVQPLPAWVFEVPVRPEYDEFGYPRVDVDRLELIRLLRAREFRALRARLAGHHQQFLRDFRYEFHVSTAYAAFQRNEIDVVQLLNEWVARAPDSPEAWLARGQNALHHAFEARGTEFVGETPEANFARMRSWMTKATRDAEAALARDPEQLMAYSTLLDVERATGDDFERAGRILRQALEASPHALVPRGDMMTQLMPKWGGSYEMMERLAADAEAHAGDNPRLRVLRGRIHFALGDELDDDDKSEEAIAEYTKALAYGRSAGVRFERGTVYHASGRHLEALRDFNEAWVDAPQWPDLLDWRGWTYHRLAVRASPAQRDRLWELAERDLALAYELAPTEQRDRDLRVVRYCRAQPAQC